MEGILLTQVCLHSWRIIAVTVVRGRGENEWSGRRKRYSAWNSRRDEDDSEIMRRDSRIMSVCMREK